MSEDQLVHFEWIAFTSEAPALQTALADGGADLQPPTAFKPTGEEQDEYAHAGSDPLTLLAGAVAIGFLVDRIVIAINDLKHGGLVVEQTDEGLKLHETSALPRGVALCMGPNGAERVDSSKPGVNIVDAIRAFVGLGKKP
jgi:hypothetical protein